MRKIKKIIVSVFIILSVLATSVLAVSGDADDIFKNQDVEKFEKIITKSEVSIYCNREWASVTALKPNHSNSYKYISCTSYTYENGKYYQQDKKDNGGTTPSVISKGSMTLNGYTQATEYYGYICNNASSNSGIIESILIYVLRSKEIFP